MTAGAPSLPDAALPPPRASSGRAQTSAWASAGLVALLAIAGVWCVDYLPTHDGPQHIFNIHASSRLDDPASGYGRFLDAGFPLTNHGFALVFAPFDRFLPWRTAVQLALSLLVLAWTASVLLLARSLHPGRLWLGVALAGGAFQWSLYMGLFSFHLATSLGLLTLALAVPPEPARGRRVLLGGLLLVVALAHVAAAALTGLALAGLAWARARPGAGLEALGRTAIIATPAATLALALLLLGFGDLESANTGSEPWSFRATPLWALGRCFFAGPAWRAWPPLLLALGAPLAWLALRHRPRSPTDRVFLVCGGLLLLAAWLAPLHLAAWDFFSLRFLPLAVCLLVLSWPLERLQGHARTAAVGCLAIFAIASSCWAISYNRELSGRASEALAGLDAPLSRSGPRLPIVLDPYLGRPLDDAHARVPYAVPLLNLGQLYATAQGGFAPFTFAHSPWVHAVVWKPEARRDFPQVVNRRYAIDLARPAFQQDHPLRRAVTTYLAGIGTHYEDVILWGSPADAVLLEELGFVPEFRSGGLLLARFRGCPLTLTFPGDALPPEDARIELGWLPAWHVTHRYPVDRRFRAPDGGLALPLENPPCGGAWLRIASESSPQQSLRCDGADAEGRLLIPSTRTTPVVECRLSSPETDA